MPTVEECRKVLDYLSSLAATHNLCEPQTTIQSLHKHFTQFDDIQTIIGLLTTQIEPTNQKNAVEIEKVEKINDENNIREITQKDSESTSNV